MTIPIVFSSDHNYIMPTGVTICSLLQTSKKVSFNIYILISNDVDINDKKLLTHQVKTIDTNSTIDFIEVGNIFDNSFEIRDISTACYYRLLIPWLLPQYEKVIYSDVDIIYLQDITEGFKEDLGDNYVAGVNTPGFSKKRTAKYISNLNIKPTHYINSGFLIINSKLQREDNLKNKYLALSKKKFLFQDQDIINIVCKNRIKLLDIVYNVSPRTAIKYKITKPIVLHYAGAKPWKAFTLRWIDWWAVYQKSLWFNPDFNDTVSLRIKDKRELIKDLWRDFKSKYFRR